MIKHPFPPLFDKNSRILILGSFPSVKSREQLFFYGHPQNRFWAVLAEVLQKEKPETVEDKKVFLKTAGIALWDVLASCEIEGSADSSIKNAAANDISQILNNAPIEQIFVNGKAAEKYYRRFLEKETGRSAICLPSTSPANAAWSVDSLVGEWKKILKYL